MSESSTPPKIIGLKRAIEKLTNRSSPPPSAPESAPVSPPKPRTDKKRTLAKSEVVRPLEATSATGEVFTIGSQIQVRDSLGYPVTAVIDSFYQDLKGETWALFKPLEKNPDSFWHKGCIRASLLCKLL
jgi:hypothetical protein